MSKEELFCSFCGKPKSMIKKLIEGPNNIFICDKCIETCQEILFRNCGNLNLKHLLIENYKNLDEIKNEIKISRNYLNQLNNIIKKNEKCLNLLKNKLEKQFNANRNEEDSN